MPKGSYRTPDIAAKMKATRIRNEAIHEQARRAQPATPYRSAYPAYAPPAEPHRRPTYSAPGCRIMSIDGELTQRTIESC